MRIESVANLDEWFRDSLTAAAERYEVAVDPATEHYMVNLMTGFSRAENFYEHTRDGYGLRPLALMLADALESPDPQVRQFGLQRLGDVSLFISGFFQDGLMTKAVDVDYYARMGGSAYDALSSLPPRTMRDHALASVFRELAEKFPQFVDLLAEVAQQARVFDERDILRLYEVYLKTGSTRARRALERLGVAPGPNASSRTEH